MNKKVIIGALLGVVVLVMIVWQLTKDTSSGTDVRAAEVKTREVVEIVSASGTIQPQTKVDITSQVTGEIIDLRVKEGDRVRSGDLLVVLDTIQLKTDLDRARYAVNEISARLEGARATLDQAKEEYDRQKQLYDNKLTSEREYKDANYTYLNYKAAFEALGAQAEQTKATYDKNLDNFRRAKVVAPMSGVITFLDVEVGEIAAAQTIYSQGRTLMTIANLDVFEVEVEVDETEIAKVDLNQNAMIEVDAFPDTSFTGEVVEIGNTAITANYGSSDQSTNFRVKVIFKEVEARIRPGMSATVDITTAERPEVLSVPFSAIVMRNMDLDSLEAAREAEATGAPSGEQTDGVMAAENDSSSEASVNEAGDDEEEREDIKGVFVVRDGKARFIPVETGIADQKYIEVVSGLEKTDTVIAGPYSVLRTVKDGDEVEAEVKKSEEASRQ
jgi:HlyD family secretion protein